jgi:uncharacterized membrane protein
MMRDNFWAHVHLAVNDVPIVGFIFASLFIVAALTTRSKDSWAKAGMLTLAVSFLGLILAFFSGDPALKVIDGQPRTSGRALMQHHIRGLFAVGFALITVVIATLAFVKARRAGGIYSRNVLIAVLITSILTAGALAWTGQAGGRINHHELQEPADRESEPAHPH